jgi:hypothetical protein
VHANPQTLDDLTYVKQALERDHSSPFPASIAVLWAAICGVGFLLADVAPSRTGLFWAVAAPAGFLASCWLGYRHSRAAGELDRREGARWMLHFASLLGAMLAASGGVALGGFAGEQMGTIALLLCGAVFLLAGLHLARPLAWVGALALAGVPAVLLVERWRWTIVGACVALAMLAAAAAGRRRTRPDGEG